MSLLALLAARAADGRPVRVGVIGAGGPCAAFLAQARGTPGLHVMAVADPDPARLRAVCDAAGWPAEQVGAASSAKALRHGGTWLTDDPDALVSAGGVEVVVECSGEAGPGLRHAAACVDHGRHVVMATLAADVLAGPLLGRRFVAAGLVYSLACGSRPALVCELVERARACGFIVRAAGSAHAEPDPTVAALEMAAVANATGLAVPPEGLSFPATDLGGLALLPFPGGTGVVEAVACPELDGGAWVVTDGGRVLWRPAPLAGIEIGISVASAALRGEATGHPAAFRGDVVAVAARDMAAGEGLGDAEGRLLPADAAVSAGLLPLGLAAGARLVRPLRAGAPVPREAVMLDADSFAARLRRELEAAFCAAPPEEVSP